MNQRIRELADDTWEYVCHNDSPKGVLKRDWYDQKFAELIIKECAGVAEISMPINSHPGDRLTVKNNVLKHFGIEE